MQCNKTTFANSNAGYFAVNCAAEYIRKIKEDKFFLTHKKLLTAYAFFHEHIIYLQNYSVIDTVHCIAEKNYLGFLSKNM